MLKIMVNRDKEKKITGYLAQGHCNYASVGKDIVCSAVSALLQTMVLAVYSEKVNIAGSIKRGGLKINLPEKINSTQKNKFQIIFEAMFLGLKEIANGYPANVSIVEVFEEEEEEVKSKIVEISPGSFVSVECKEKK